MTDEGPDNEWKTLATWLYDETVGTQKDADSIANDFIEGVSGTLAIKRAKQVKQKKKRMTTEPPIRSFSQSVL